MTLNPLISKKIFILSFLIFVLFGCADIDKISLGNGYMLSWPSRDHTRILKDGKVYIPATIVSYDTTIKYVVGLRLKLRSVTCSNGDTTMVTNARMYFILNKDNGRVYNFNSKKEFSNKLRELEIEYNISLDYSEFDIVWGYYSASYINPNDTYWSSCKGAKI